jgi:L-malate glycosyltransferase
VRVIHIASGDLWGGAEAQVWALATALLGHGVEVGAILMNRGSRLASELSSSGIASLLELDESRTSMIELLRQIRRHLRAWGPDVVHTHRLKEDILGGGAAALVGIPSLRTVHGAPEPETRQGIRRAILSTADRWVARRLQSRAVAVSSDLESKLAQLLPGAKLAVIPNGISFSAVRKAASAATPPLPQATPDPVRVGFFGRLVEVKRVDLLLRVAGEVAGLTARPFEFYIVGDGPLRHCLSDLTREIRAPERVHFLGYQAQAAALMRQMDAVMLVSDHEGMPMVLLEAAVLGIPVFARAVGGIPEFVAGTGWGHVIDSSSPRVLAERLVGAGLRSGRGAQPLTADTASLEDYSIQVTSGRYLALYEQIVAESRR